MNKLFYIYRSLIIISLLCFFACNDDNPVKSKGPCGYNIYFYDYRYPQKCFYYNTVSQNIDSFYLPVIPVYDITVSAVGKYLFVPTEYEVIVVDWHQNDIVTELPYDSIHDIAVSPDGELVALQGNGLYILRSDNYHVIYHDSARTMGGHFSSNSEYFYYAGSGGWPSLAYKLNLRTLEITSKDFSHDLYEASVGRVVPSNDDSLWFVYYSIPPYPYENYYFAVYNLSADQIIYADNQRPGRGNIAVSQDGKYAFYTNPGGTISQDFSPPYSFRVYDIENNALLKEISTVLTFDDTLTVYFPTEEICVTPDSKWLVALSWGYDEIVIVNLATMEIEKQFALGGKRCFSGLTCQLR